MYIMSFRLNVDLPRVRRLVSDVLGGLSRRPDPAPPPADLPTPDRRPIHPSTAGDGPSCRMRSPRRHRLPLPGAISNVTPAAAVRGHIEILTKLRVPVPGPTYPICQSIARRARPVRTVPIWR